MKETAKQTIVNGLTAYSKYEGKKFCIYVNKVPVYLGGRQVYMSVGMAIAKIVRRFRGVTKEMVLELIDEGVIEIKELL